MQYIVDAVDDDEFATRLERVGDDLASARVAYLGTRERIDELVTAGSRWPRADPDRRARPELLAPLRRARGCARRRSRRSRPGALARRAATGQRTARGGDSHSQAGRRSRGGGDLVDRRAPGGRASRRCGPGRGGHGLRVLPWPASRPPTRSTLEARARELVSVEHGRIDAAGEPIAAYLPLLRVGAMVSFAASLALRFHEQEEVWVDARTGTEVGERLMSTVRGRALLPVPDGARRRLEADLTAAIPAAHRQLEERALRRESSLASHARRALDTELARANAYYASALESIARRRANAAAGSRSSARCPGRGDGCRTRPALPRDRGRASPPARAAAVPPASRAFAGVRLAGRSPPAEPGGLGSNSPGFRPPASSPTSAARPATRPSRSSRRASGSAVKRDTAPSGSAPTAGAAARSDSSRSSASTRSSTSSEPGADDESLGRRRHADVVPERRSSDEPSTRPNRSQFTGSPSATARLPSRRSSPGQVKRTGNKVRTFWDCAANGGRWPRQKTARDSPLRALYRLYGRAGPLYAIGVPPGGCVEEMAASTYPSQPGAPELTVGNVKASGEVTRTRCSGGYGGQARCRRDHAGAASAGPPPAEW